MIHAHLVSPIQEEFFDMSQLKEITIPLTWDVNVNQPQHYYE